MRTNRWSLFLLGCVVGVPLAACATEVAPIVLEGDVEEVDVEAAEESFSAAPAVEGVVGKGRGGGFSAQSQCGATWDSEYVESWFGEGIPDTFVSYHQRPVGYHVQGPCSGTLISDDLFLSAGNCGYAVGDLVRFNYQLTPDGWYRPTREVAVTQIVEQQDDASWDYAIVRLAGSPGREFGHANLGAVDSPTSDSMIIISHPHHLKEVHVGPVAGTLPTQGANWFSYFVDTDVGSSGAGILDDDGQLVGIHTDGGCIEPLLGNQGMRMSRLVTRSPTLAALTRHKVLWRYLNTALVSLWTVDASGARTGAVGFDPGSPWEPLSYSNNQLIWRHPQGNISVWTLNDAGAVVATAGYIPAYRWHAVSAANGRVLLRHNFTGSVALWTLDAAGNFVSRVEHEVAEGWMPVNYANNHILWRHNTSGAVSLWRLDDAGNVVSSRDLSNEPGWFPISYENGQVLWKKNDGSVAMWLIAPFGNDDIVLHKRPYRENPGWTPLGMSDRKVSWRHTSGLFSLWKVGSFSHFLGDYAHEVDVNWRPVAIAGARP
jgi:Trypsin-like peptidase domain